MLNDGLYAFDEADPELTLLPMAARRALDAAGRHLPLAGWQALPHAQRQVLVALGAATIVAADQVRDILDRSGLTTTSLTAVPEPRPEAPPDQVVTLLGASRPLSPSTWAALGALDRYTLAKLAGRGRRERLARAYDEIVTKR